jgi:hypothetical protein
LGAVKKAIVLLAVGLGCVVPVACSSSSSGTTGEKDASTDGGAAADSDAHIINDPQNCIPPGTPNNAAGVGGYCSPGGGQCANAGPDAEGTICTADFGSVVPAHAWFCTDLCELDAAFSCGNPGPPCISAEGELVCVPPTCMAFVTALEEAGTDGGGGADAPADAPTGQ